MEARLAMARFLYAQETVCIIYILRKRNILQHSLNDFVHFLINEMIVSSSVIQIVTQKGIL